MAEAARPLNLYSIDTELRAMEDAFLDAGGELTPEDEARYMELLEKRPEKLAGYYRVIRRNEASAKAYKEETARLAALQKTHENTAKKMKAMLLESMQKQAQRDIDLPGTGRIKVQKAGTVPVHLLVDTPEELPERFRKVTTAANLSEIGAALKAGDEEAAKYAKFGEASEYLRLY